MNIVCSQSGEECAAKVLSVGAGVITVHAHAHEQTIGIQTLLDVITRTPDGLKEFQKFFERWDLKCLNK